MAKIFSQAQMDEIYAYFKNKMNSLQCIRMIEIKPFNECSWEDIVYVCDKYYSGDVSIEQIKEVWNIGDSKDITIAAMGAPADYTSSAQQTKTFTLIGIGHDNLTTSINGKDKACITLATKDVLSNAGYMENNSSQTYNYYNGPCRNWAVNYFQPSLPTVIKDNLVSVTKVMGDTTFNDKVFVPSRTEYTGEGDEGIQYEYYQNINNRKKSVYSWTRTQVTFNSTSRFYLLYPNGNCVAENMGQYNMSPAFCL